jgi:hypothetical protein
MLRTLTISYSGQNFQALPSQGMSRCSLLPDHYTFSPTVSLHHFLSPAAILLAQCSYVCRTGGALVRSERQPYHGMPAFVRRSSGTFDCDVDILFLPSLNNERGRKKTDT